MSLVTTDLRGNASEVSTPQPIQVLRPKDINAFLFKKGYKLGKVIGEGSFSKVRICDRIPKSQEAEKPRSLIACKIIDKCRASKNEVEKFLPRELEIVGRLKHPNIVEVLSVVEHLQNVFIFMDYCDKGDLLDCIKKQEFIPEDLARHYFKQILMAVQYLHSMDISHRDLKCENVLLTKNDQVKLSDFGFARACRDVRTGKLILSSTYCGSVAYAAPEILQGTQYNPKLYDMWSAGCTLFVILTGYMPFDESDVPRMLHRQLKKILTYPRVVKNLISPCAKKFIRYLLEPDVTRRATVDQALGNPWLDMDHLKQKETPVTHESQGLI